MSPKKQKHIGSVGAYLLQADDRGGWTTLMHRRSSRVSDDGNNVIATPGGSIEQRDCYDESNAMNTELSFTKPLMNEVRATTGLALDGIRPDRITRIEVPGSGVASHRNYIIRYPSGVKIAEPHEDSAR